MTSVNTLSSASSASAANLTRNAPSYIIDLDLPPEERWTCLLAEYKEKLKSLILSVEKSLGNSLLVDAAASLLSKLLSTKRFALYSGEMESIASAIGVDVGKVVMLQLAYEMYGACTSMAFDGDQPVLWRSMDWNVPQLADLTVQLEFQTEGKTVFRAASWVGYVGVLTGMNRCAAISVNYRRCGDSMWDNLRSAIDSHWPAGFLVRHVLTNPHLYSCYKLVQLCLQKEKLIAPTYFVVTGASGGLACLITRDRAKDLHLLPMTGAGREWSWFQLPGCLLQTNMDHWLTAEEAPWQDIEWSDYRRRFAYDWIRTTENSFENVETLMQTEPIKAPDTIYYSKMCCATGEMLTKVFQ